MAIDIEFRNVVRTLACDENMNQKTPDAAHIEKTPSKTLISLKKASDGVTILKPQPTTDPGDPLNWSQTTKWLMLAAVSFCAIIPDMQAGFGIPLVPVQAAYWNISINDSGRSMSGNVFMIGVGGVIAVPLAQRFGRLPVLAWSMFMSFWMSLFCTLAPDPISFIVARCLQTTFSAAPEVIGLCFIHDLFFFHEHAQAIGIWAASFVASPFIGPLISGLIANWKPWRNSFGACTAISGFAFVLVPLFVKETFYDRHHSVTENKQSTGCFNSNFQNLIGIYGAKVKGRTSVLRSFIRLGVIATRPYFSFILIFYAMSFMRSVGCNTSLNMFLFTPVAEGGYGFTELDVGLIYFSPIIAVVLGEIFGHYFNDYLANSYIKRHAGHYEPEVRLWAVWMASPFMIGGLIFLGFSLQDHLPWITVALAWGVYMFGTLLATVGITAYALDVFQDEGPEASALINFVRTLGGFIINYFQLRWAGAVGPALSFGTQGIICFVAFFLVIIVQWKGRVWRERFPPSKGPRFDEGEPYC